MTSLFKDKKASEVVTVDAVKQLTGITSDDFHLSESTSLDKLLREWIDETASNIHVRLGRQVDPKGADGPGVRGVLVRTVANIVATAQQQRSSPVIQLGDFATNVLNTSDALDRLDDELVPFINYTPPGDDDGTGKNRYDVFWSSQEYVEPTP